jgi:hypothetical protein
MYTKNGHLQLKLSQYLVILIIGTDNNIKQKKYIYIIKIIVLIWSLVMPYPNNLTYKIILKNKSTSNFIKW